MRLILAACVAALLAGCCAVYTTRPIGEKTTDIQNAKEEWDGTWIHPDGAMTVKVVDGSNGVLRVQWIQEDRGDLESKRADVYLRDGGGWTFANIKPKEETNDNRYVWARIQKKERVAILWGPDVAKFKDLVKKGRMPGSVDGNDVVLGHLTSNDLAIITSETNGVLLDWDNPFVLFKSSK